VLNRKKSGGGAAAGAGAEFFNAAEASQLNTLLRGNADPDKVKRDDEANDSREPGAATEKEVRFYPPKTSPPPITHADRAVSTEILASLEPPLVPRPPLSVPNFSIRRREQAVFQFRLRIRRSPSIPSSLAKRRPPPAVVHVARTRAAERKPRKRRRRRKRRQRKARKRRRAPKAEKSAPSRPPRVQRALGLLLPEAWRWMRRR
jgi:hypothetical protein